MFDLTKKYTKKISDIQSRNSKNREGFIVDLRKTYSDKKNSAISPQVPIPQKRKKLVSIAQSSPLVAVSREALERDQIFRELRRLEIQEQNRHEKLEENISPKEIDLVELATSFKPELVKQVLPSIERSSIAIRARAKIRAKIIFIIFSLLFSFIIPTFLLYQKAQAFKGEMVTLVGDAIDHIKQAGQSISDSDFENSLTHFQEAQDNFSQGSEKLNRLGAGVLGFFDKIPGVSFLPNAERMLRVGNYLTQAAQELTLGVSYFLNTDLNVYNNNGEPEDNSLIQAILSSRPHLAAATEKISDAKMELELIRQSNLQSNFKEQTGKIEEALEQIRTRLDKTSIYTEALLKILGNDQPKLYLFIFQNNQEIRATGGFIGTYGLFKINNGKIEKVLVDGIYNPDGQLKEKVVPPFPLWKISPTWGLRDANWFANFPTSAKKIIWFYEKTGGPTVDGVVSFTPTVMERLLKIIGPIEMPEYGVTVTAENFVEVTQKEVEIDYDKEKNTPKQFLTDLTPIVLERIFHAPKEKMPEIFKVFSQNTKERHIMFYFLNEDLENLVLEEGIGGALREAPKDYLSVVNSNIDGRKTDGIIDNEIYHKAQIQEDGSVIDTVTIKRAHWGGLEEYDWWNSENKNFLRIYVPRGSTLLDAQGFSKETPAPLLGIDYSEYRTDELVREVESTKVQDEKSGTWIFEETGKTVFGNWVYTGPGKTSEVSFTYKLPFNINDVMANSYSLLVQKQGGTMKDKLFTTLEVRPDDEVVWRYPSLVSQETQLKMETDLELDRFYGAIIKKK